jgi:hypothetical protein
MEEHARGHWHEFSIIVASANVLLALLLFGRVITTAHNGWPTYIATGISVASISAAILAYYSLQVGHLLIFGPLHVLDVLASFVIAAAQLALFLWPTHVLGTSWADGHTELGGLRHWLVFFAAFALVAPVASLRAGRARRRMGLGSVFPRYESGQRADRFAASVTGLLTAASWALSFWFLVPSLVVGVAVALVGTTTGILSQSRTINWLTSDLARAREGLAHQLVQPSANSHAAH